MELSKKLKKRVKEVVRMNLEERINEKEKQVKTRMNRFLRKIRKDNPNFNRTKAHVSINTDKYKVEVFPDGRYLVEYKDNVEYMDWVTHHNPYANRGMERSRYLEDKESRVSFQGLYGKDHNLLAIGNNENAEIEVKEHGYYTIDRKIETLKGEKEETSLYNKDNKELARSNWLSTRIYAGGKIRVKDCEKEVQMLYSKKGRKLAETKGGSYENNIYVYDTEEYKVTAENEIERLYTSNGRKIAQTNNKKETVKPLGKGFYAIQPEDDTVQCKKPPKIKASVYNKNRVKIGEADFLVEKINSTEETLELKGYKYEPYEEYYEYWDHHQCNDQSPVCDCRDTFHSGYTTKYRKISESKRLELNKE